MMKDSPINGADSSTSFSADEEDEGKAPKRNSFPAKDRENDCGWIRRERKVGAVDTNGALVVVGDRLVDGKSVGLFVVDLDGVIVADAFRTVGTEDGCDIGVLDG
jgi:hypothetical protein